MVSFCALTFCVFFLLRLCSAQRPFNPILQSFWYYVVISRGRDEELFKTHCVFQYFTQPVDLVKSDIF